MAYYNAIHMTLFYSQLFKPERVKVYCIQLVPLLFLNGFSIHVQRDYFTQLTFKEQFIILSRQ